MRVVNVIVAVEARGRRCSRAEQQNVVLTNIKMRPGVALPGLAWPGVAWCGVATQRASNE